MTSDVLSFSLNSFPKVQAVEITLQQTMTCLKDLIQDYDKLSKENMDYKTKFYALEEKCNCKSSSSQESLKKEIDQKNCIIQQIASALTNLMETKDFKVVDEIFKIICGKTKLIPNNRSPQKESSEEDSQDQSIFEIEGTPGHKSPIIALCRKVKNNSTHGLNLNKKKSQQLRGTSEKCVKLVYSSPSQSKGSGRLKQSRLNVLKVKSSLVVDLTCSPEAVNTEEVDMCNVKKELENEETILPSPTSRTFCMPQMFKPIAKDISTKFKKPQSPSKFKLKEECHDENCSETYTQNSVDLMKHCRRLRKAPLCENNTVLNTQCDLESSLSILQRGISPPQATLNKRTKLERVEPVYKEPTVRKKSEKRALPGWSCDECKQFYGLLYANDVDLLAEKMEECSKHRGRNNPIRPSTPKGFWDPRWDVPTNTEEFNRRNNAE